MSLSPLSIHDPCPAQSVQSPAFLRRIAAETSTRYTTAISIDDESFAAPAPFAGASLRFSLSYVIRSWGYADSIKCTLVSAADFITGTPLASYTAEQAALAESWLSEEVLANTSIGDYVRWSCARAA